MGRAPPQLGRLRGVGISVFFVVSATLWLAFVLVPSYVLRANRSLHRRLISAVFGSFWTISVYWLEVLNGVRFFFSGTELGRSTDTSAIIICNHLTESDMPFFWHIPYRLGVVGDVKFVAKAAVRKAPILGWGINVAEYLFLRRDWARDQQHIATFLGSFAPNDRMLWVLFPEGTDMEPHKVPVSQKYQREHGLPVTTHVLHPKHRGLHAMLQRLRRTHPHTVLYDYTMTYVPTVKGPKTVLFGLGPKECHIHVRRVPLDKIPEAEQAMKDWTIETFVEKDRQLQHFSEHGKFDGPEINAPLGALDALRVLMLLVVFLLVDGASVWAMWTHWQARVWLLVSCVSLQVWCTFAGDATLLGMPAHPKRL